MQKQKKSAMVRFPVILLAVSAILLCASPCSALDIYGRVTIPSEQYPSPIDEDVVVESGGTLNLEGGVINGFVKVEYGGMLNFEGGYIRDDMFAYNFSEVKITGGEVGGFIFVDLFANVTVFGTDFYVTNGEIDSSEPYFTPLGSLCVLEVTYGGVVDSIDLTFIVAYTTEPDDPDVHIYLAAPVTEVIFDIKPGSDQNSINLKSKGVVPVAVFSTYNFDAGTIDPATVEFAGAEPVRWKLEDIDDDGDDDLMLHFKTKELDLDQDSTEATLTAELLTEEQETVFWTDEVRIVPSKKK